MAIILKMIHILKKKHLEEEEKKEKDLNRKWYKMKINYTYNHYSLFLKENPKLFIEHKN